MMTKNRATATLVNSKRDKRADNPGRPSRYNPDVHPKFAKALCSKGATIVEIANAFGVCIATIWNWKVKYPEFTESCRVGFEAATDRVERSIFERAVGYTHEAMKIFLPAGASKPVYAPYLKHVPPDPRAGEFWLTNRAPDRWKHKQNVEHNEASENPIRILAEQISGNAIRPRVPEPKLIKHVAAEPNAIRSHQPAARRPSVTTNDEPVTRATVVKLDQDEDTPRVTRFHTVSKAYQDDEGDV